MESLECTMHGKCVMEHVKGMWIDRTSVRTHTVRRLNFLKVISLISLLSRESVRFSVLYSYKIVRISKNVLFQEFSQGHIVDFPAIPREVLGCLFSTPTRSYGFPRMFFSKIFLKVISLISLLSRERC
ncbi:unnamed protein product [Larinioides sclopetarius]|uniref:Uncharacterized protein n=1 Tax=Larinioides sclopetarius TaxID=280406 RepID=A0AAV2B8J8_9ARAC